MMDGITIFFDNTLDRVIEIFDHVFARILPYSDDRSIATIRQRFSWMGRLSISESEESLDKSSWRYDFTQFPIFRIFSSIFFEISFHSKEVCMDEEYSFFLFCKRKKLSWMREWKYFFVEDYRSKMVYLLEYTEIISDNNNLLMIFDPFSSKKKRGSCMWKRREENSEVVRRLDT